MSNRIPISALLLTFIAGMALSACLPSGGGGGGSTGGPLGNGTVEVTLAVREPASEPGTNFVSTTPLAHIGTSLIIAVPEGTAVTSLFEDIPAESVLAEGLLDLSGSTITLELPLLTSMQLVEYTFNDDDLTLEEILADTPVAGPPNTSTAFTISASDTDIEISLPIQTTSFTETFGGSLSPVRWESVSSKAKVSGGELVMTANGTFDSSGSFEEWRAGDRTDVRSNHNLLLANQRVAGTVSIEDFATTNVDGTNQADNTPPAADARVRVTGGELRYQPRDLRGSANSKGFTGARIIFNGRTETGISARLDAFSCSGTDSTCAQPFPTDLFIQAPFSTATLSASDLPSPSYAFSLEYLGGGLFKGTFNGETQLVNIFTHPLGATFFAANPDLVFTRDDFLGVQMRAQGDHVWDDGDTADVTSAHDNMQVGTAAPAAPSGTGTKLADSLVLFDDFSQSAIDFTKWSSNSLEFVLEIRDEELVTAARGSTGTIALLVVDADSVDDISADIRIDNLNISGGFSEPGAEIVGSFFNDGSSSGSGDRTGDIRADMQLADGDLFSGVGYSVNRCEDSGCSSVTNITGGALGGYSTGDTRTLRIQYDGASTITFSVDGVSPVSIDTGYSNGGTPGDSFKLIGVFSNQPGDSIVAAIDNVKVNGAAYDDFSASTGLLDSTKWVNLESLREVRDGELVIVHKKTSPASNSITATVANPSLVNAVAADVTVTEIDSGTASSAGDAQARIQNFWYNDGRGSSGDITGDAVAVIRAREFTVEWGIFVCESNSCSSNNLPVTNPSWNTLGVIEPGSTHTLYSAWDDSTNTATFQLDDLPAATFAPEDEGLTVAGPPVNTSKVLRTRVSNNGTSLSATFDNVRLGADLPTQLAGALSTYDDFSGGYDPFLWNESGDFTVGIVSGALEMTVAGDSGTDGEARLALHEDNLARGMVTDVSIPTAIALNNGGGNICGRFFQDADGNIVDTCVELSHDGFVGYQVRLCEGGDLDNCNVIGSGSFSGQLAAQGDTARISLLWTPNTAVQTLKAEIPKGASEQILTFNAATQGTTLVPFSSALSAGDYYLALETFGNLNDGGSITAVYDNVGLDTNGDGAFNASHDTFAGTTIDTALWSGGERSRVLDSGNGELQMSTVDASLELDFSEAQPFGAFAADVAVNTATDDGIAYLIQLLYGDTDGNPVLAVIGMTDTEAFNAVVVVDEVSNSLQILQAGTLATSLTAGQAHTLFMQWDGSNVTYQFDSDAYVKVDPSSLATPSTVFPGSFKSLQVATVNRNAAAGENAFSTGSVDAVFSNVRVGGVLPVP